MSRRNFVVQFCSMALAWPFAVRAQRQDAARRISFLIGFHESDQDAQRRLAVLRKSFASHGWIEGRNLQVDVNWTNADAARAAMLAKQIVVLKPDLILTATTAATAAVKQETASIPIVFLLVSDPIGSGFVKTLARPGGNITGIVNYEGTLAGKWLEVLKDVAPQVKQAAVMFNPKTAPYFEYYMQPIRSAAPSLGVNASAAPVGSEVDIERVIADLGRSKAGGLIVMTDPAMVAMRKVIIDSAARHKVPAVYFYTSFIDDGGLICYGIDIDDMFRRIASLSDRILRGTKPEDLPVELPTKFEIMVNLRTAKALGLTIPQTVLLRADRVIE